MRLLHTSDWHLGATLHQFDRTYEHERFLEWLAGTLEEQCVDALVIAGDVFDNSNPSAASQRMLYCFLGEARRRVPHLNIVITAGNHDSPGRIEAPADILSSFDTHAIGYIQRDGGECCVDNLVVPLKNRSGEVAAWCIAMPFLRPSDVPTVQGEGDAYAAGIQALYQQAYEHACRLRTPGQALIAMGHCHMTGAAVSQDSERNIVIGGAETLSASIFQDDIAYIALGHLHRAQVVGGNPTRRYSGSPLPMSLSERNYNHQVILVDLDGEAVANIQELAVPRTVDMMYVPAQPAPVQDVLLELAGLDLPERPPAEWPYLLVRVLLTEPEPALRTKVEEALAGKQVRLARIETKYNRQASAQAARVLTIDEINALSPVHFFEVLYKRQFNAAPSAELLAAFDELVNTSNETVAE